MHVDQPAFEPSSPDDRSSCPIQVASSGKMAPSQHLSKALLDSRERWQDMALLGNDFTFEADPSGRICFIAPANSLGYKVGQLLGKPGASLLADVKAEAYFDPFMSSRPEVHRRAWLLDVAGRARCFSISVRPLVGERNEPTGVRGVARDITQQNEHELSLASALRRGEVLEHIMWRMRQEVLAPRMMQVVLEALMNALGAGGVVLLNSPNDNGQERSVRGVGTTPNAVINCIFEATADSTPAPRVITSDEQHSVLLCPTSTRYGKSVSLGLWRDQTSRPWDVEDQLITSAISSVVGVVLEHETIQHEMARQARTDPLTGLLNRRAFFEEVDRHISRSEHSRLPNVLMYIDLDHFKWINDVWGHEAGDDCLCRLGELLRSTFRPTDLVARLGGDEFAVWMDGSDQFTAAERAERLCQNVRPLFHHLANGRQPALGASIGIACRGSESGEGIDSLMRRADLAMYQIKRNRRGHWLVSQDEPIG